MNAQWLTGHDNITRGALWHGDGVEMLRALGQRSTPIQLILASPPYGIGKEYEVRMALDEYVAWQTDVLRTCVTFLSEGGSIAWQVGNWVDRGRGGVHPLDVYLFPVLKQLGLTPRGRIVWTVDHGHHARYRLSGRYETVLWFTKDRPDGGYLFDLDAVRVPQLHPRKRHFKGPKKGQLSCHPLGKNPGDVWTDICQVKANHRERTKHPAQMPLALAERVIQMTTGIGDLVVDPFAGACTTVVAARRLGRSAAGADLCAAYLAIGEERLAQLTAGTLPCLPSRAKPRSAA